MTARGGSLSLNLQHTIPCLAAGRQMRVTGIIWLRPTRRWRKGDSNLGPSRGSAARDERGDGKFVDHVRCASSATRTAPPCSVRSLNFRINRRIPEACDAVTPPSPLSCNCAQYSKNVRRRQRAATRARNQREAMLHEAHCSIDRRAYPARNDRRRSNALMKGRVSNAGAFGHPIFARRAAGLLRTIARAARDAGLDRRRHQHRAAERGGAILVALARSAATGDAGGPNGGGAA